MTEKVLVASSDAFDLKLLEEFCTAAGYDVLTAASRSALVETMNAAEIDVLLLDLELDGGHGVDALRDLSEDATTATVPVVMIASRDDLERREEGLTLGATDYVSKPFRITEIERRLRSAITLGVQRRSAIPPRMPSDPAPRVDSADQLLLIVEYEYVRATRYAHDLSVIALHARCSNPEEGGKPTSLLDPIIECLRGADQLHRLGNDTFVIVLPETACDVHTTVATRIEEALRQACGDTLELRIGAACTSEEDVSDAESLLRKAMGASAQGNGR